MPKKQKPDKILAIVLGALILIGAITLLSASIPQSKEDFGNIYGYFMHQAFFGFLLGGVGALALYLIPYKKIQKLAPFIFFISLIFLVIVFVPGLGVQTSGAQRWIDLHFATFQPSELVKFTFIVYMAAWLASREKNLKNKESFVSVLIFMGILSMLLLLQPNVSALGIIVIIGGIMYFTAGASLKYISSLVMLGVGGFFVVVQGSSYRMNRILAFLKPESDPLGLGYQINQVLIAVGSGQIFGVGPFMGTQKEFIPLAMNDSIFAILAEETGFIGALIVILLYIIIAWRGIKISLSAKDNFARFAATGIVTWIFLQAFINIASTIGLFPLTGVTLPFISYGSSSLAIMLAASGFLLQLSKSR